MRALIRKLGYLQVIILITVFAIISAEILAYLISQVFSLTYHFPSAPLITFVVTAILTPFISWPLLKLLFDIDKLEQKMNYLATYDSMTKLLSRQAFFKKSLVVHKSFQKDLKTYCICILDIDNFKSINDSFGHSIGDTVLMDFGKIFHNVLKLDYLVGRIGGEEFALFFYGDINETKTYLEELQQTIFKSPIPYKGSYIPYTVSIGIFENTQVNSISFDNALSKADKALYYAKSTGKNKYIIFSEVLSELTFKEVIT